MPSADKTTNYGLSQWADNEFVKREDFVADNVLIDTAIKDASDKAEQAFTQADNGKSAIKSAIVGKDPDITIPTDATFAQLATAIGQIQTGVDTGDATATAEQILAGMTAYVKGQKVTGNMANRGAVSQSLGINGSYTIPAGYHNGQGKISQSIPVKDAATYTPGTANNTIGAGQYLSGAQTILGDANLVPGNILSGKSIFGVWGNVVAGKRFQIGTDTRRASGMSFERYSYNATIVSAGMYGALAFKPSVIIIVVKTSEQRAALTVYLQNFVQTHPESIFMSMNNALGYESGTNNYWMKAQYRDAFVNDTGFCLPCGSIDYPGTFIAFE